MHQAGVVALADEFEQMGRGINVGGEGVAQVGIEVGEAGAVDDEIEGGGEAFAGGGVEAEAGGAYVAFDDFEFFFEEGAEVAAVAFLEAIDGGGFFEDFFEAALGGGGAVAAD